MLPKNYHSLLGLLGLLAAVSACKTSTLLAVDPSLTSTPGATATPVPTATPIPTPVPVVAATVNAGLYFKLSAAWDSGGDYTAQAPLLVDNVSPFFPTGDDCKVAVGAAASVGHTCTFSLPENQLYFSNLKMTVGTADPNTCTYVRFYPYFYMGEGPLTPPDPAVGPSPVPYSPVWALKTTGLAMDPVSCLGFTTGLPLNNDVGALVTGEMRPKYATLACYNGPATQLAGFPSVKYVGIQAITTQELTFPVTSAHSNSQISNRFTANDISNAAFTGGPAIYKEYYSNSINHYVAQCLDQFGALVYETKVTLTARSDLMGTPATTYKTWKPNPATSPTATPAPTATPVPTVASPTPTPTPNPASVTSEMYFMLDSAYDAGGSYSHQVPVSVEGVTASYAFDSCKIPLGTAAGAGHTCRFEVPESQLYLSKLRMRMGSTDSAVCPVIKFYPYFYTINGPAAPADPSGAAPAGVLIPWLLTPTGVAPTSAVCYDYYANTVFPVDVGTPATALLKPKYLSGISCYNGPASTIAGFPLVKSTSVQTTYNQELVFDVSSASSGNQATNRWTANDLAAGSRGGVFGAANEYLPNSMNDYVLQCLNQNGTLKYETIITISASGTGAGSSATLYKTWR